MKLDREKAFGPRRSDYEIWFGTVLDVSGIALWFRYTILHRPGFQSVCALWAAVFDSEKPAAQTADSWPLTEMRMEDHQIHLPQGTLSANHVQGKIQNTAWDLQIQHVFPAESHVPAWLLHLPFVRTKSIVLSPFARFTGVLQSEGRSWQIDGSGTWTHIYGKERVPELYWCFVPRFDNADVGMELFSVRPKSGLPLLTFFTLREGQTLRHTSILRAVRNKCTPGYPDFRARSADFPETGSSPASGTAFSLECSLSQAHAASFIYVDPDSSNRYVVQSDIGSAMLTLGDGRTFESKGGAQVEFHGLNRWHSGVFLDPYRKYDGL